jgi:hypothetical protein
LLADFPRSGYRGNIVGALIDGEGNGSIEQLLDWLVWGMGEEIKMTTKIEQ